MKKRYDISSFLFTLSFALYPISALALYKIFFVGIAASFTSLLFSGKLKRWTTFIKNPTVILALLLFALPFASQTWSQFPEETLNRSPVVLLQILIFIASATIFMSNGWRFGISTSLVIATTLAIVSIYLLHQYGSIRATSREMKDFSGAFSNLASSTFLVLFPLFLKASKKHANAAFLYAGLGISIIVIVLSESRSAIALLLFGFLMLTLFSPERKAKRVFNFLVFSLAVATTTAFLVIYLKEQITSLPVVGRFLDSQLVSGSGPLASILSPDSSANDYMRALMYNTGLEVIENNWLIGAGYGSIKGYMDLQYGFGVVSHNWIITCLGELGITGLILFLAFVTRLLIGLYRATNNHLISLNNRMLSSYMLVSLSLLITQGLSRPLLSNPMLGLLAGISFGIITISQRSTMSRDVVKSSI